MHFGPEHHPCVGLLLLQWQVDRGSPFFHGVLWRRARCRGALIAGPVAAQAGLPSRAPLEHLPQLLHLGHGCLRLLRRWWTPLT